ncbi:aminotransferase [Rugosibacter aromaticivorans]|uniref:Aminotransferase n=1 Tax=Rugosibacter aromaticivorans TaxID=1565605 RepID=A0A0C5J7B0_9PROT|nr:fatty acid desaturase [Rugosibacter aromaticivorans]AJP47835.1 aminotransferase [Rugosibacter aromaticivorans]TBR16140.1 MAG: acyl-CoA desaturase [Rugosibacter sp.]
MYSGIIELPWWGYFVLTLALTHISIASVTIYLHRHQAHRALDLSPIPSHFFRFWLWLTTGMVTKEWAAIHRKHHAKCETTEDPHSPQILGIQPVLWTGVFFYVKESRNAETMVHYGHGTPDDWLEHVIYTPLNKLGVFIMLGINIAFFGPWIGSLIWLIQMIWIPFWAAGVINGIGHYWGYRNFACADASTNIFPIGILIGGEELHNNHHTFASSAKLSSKWYEFDIGWFYIRLLEIVGLAKVKKIAPTPRFDLARPAIDFDLLQAVVTHRYDVLAKYLKSLHHLASEEFSQLSIDAKEGRVMKHLLGKDENSLPVAQHARLATLLEKSERLARVYAMRKDLEALWSRSAVTHDQLVKQLEAWITRAEQSGIRQMEEFSLRLRTYAV